MVTIFNRKSNRDECSIKDIEWFTALLFVAETNTREWNTPKKKNTFNQLLLFRKCEIKLLLKLCCRSLE